MVTNRKVEVDRISIVSNKTFEEAVAALEASVGRPNMAEYMKEMMETKTYAEMEAVMQKAVAGTGFMIFMGLGRKEGIGT